MGMASKVKVEPKYQVFCEIRGGEVIPISPVAPKDFCDKILTAMAQAIHQGCQPDACNPHMVRVLI